MNAMPRRLRTAALWALIGVSLALAACGTMTEIPPAPNLARPLDTPVGTIDQAPTRRSNNTGNQALATAEIERANAQATLDSANATVGAAQTQSQNSANVFAAQLASTAEIEAAHAQATLSSAGSTQSAGLIQDAIQQTQAVDVATSSAEAILNQQNRDELAAGTQTAVANNIATQTQVAVATSQWYTDQARQRGEQSRVAIAWLWMLCLPIFSVLVVGLVLWGFWRWLRIRQANQRIFDGPIEQLQAPAAKVVDHQHDDSLPYLEGDDIDSRYELTKPDDQVHRWLDEVKRKLRSSDQKDEDDDTNS